MNEAKSEKTAGDMKVVVDSMAKDIWELLHKQTQEYIGTPRVRWLLMARAVNMSWVQFYNPAFQETAQNLLAAEAPAE